MPPKTKITKESILQAAFEIIRKDGYEKINARSLSKMLNCSTQPILYHFSSMEELKRKTYQMADDFHTKYLFRFNKDPFNPLLEIGLNYVRFAAMEKNIFRFIFQSGYIQQKSIVEMIDSSELDPIFNEMEKEASINQSQAKEIFLILAMFVHGYASLIANSNMEYDEKSLTKELMLVFNGAYASIKEEEKD